MAHSFSIKKPSYRTVDTVFIHCSASDKPEHDDVAVIRNWHLARGFYDVGYHWFIKKDGTLQVGRDLELLPAAQKGHNKGSIAICLHGLSSFTEEQFDTLRGLCAGLGNAFAPAALRYRGHCEVSSKTCPVFDYRRVLGLGKDGFRQISVQYEELSALRSEMLVEARALRDCAESLERLTRKMVSL